MLFTISTQFKKYRGEKGDRGGVVRITVMSNRRDHTDFRVRREMNLDIYGADKSVISAHRDEITGRIRLLYCIIERLVDNGREFSLDDVVGGFRQALAGDSAYAEAIEKSKTDFPLRADLVSVGREFRGCFQYVHPAKTVNGNSLSDYIDARISALKNERKSSRVHSYEATHTKLKEFTGKDNIPFSAINRNLIERFAMWLKSGGITESTQSFYLRTLRSILNHAREEHFLTGEGDWFRRVDTRILFDRPAGKAANLLGRETLKKIHRLDLHEDPETALTRDMFMFAFYCHGMELVDIAHLTPDNVRDSCLVYSRRKEGRTVVVPLDSEALGILRHYEAAGSRYLFPFLYDDGRFTFESMRSRMHIAIKKIGNAVDFPRLSFSMNIAAYRNCLSQCRVSDLL